MTRPPAHPVVDQDVASHPGFQRALETGRDAHSFGANTAPPLWVHPLATPLERDEPYYMAATLNLNQVRQLLLDHGLTHTEASLLGPDGPVVATDGHALDSLMAQHENDIAAGEEMVDTGDRFVSSVAVAGSDAIILLSGSKAPLHAAQWEVAVRSIVLAASLTLVAVLLGSWTSRRITRPLSHLERTSRIMGKGHLHVRAVPTGPSEVQHLATTLNQMATDLDQERQELLGLQGHLETLVEERTGQLVERRKGMEQFFYGASHDIKSPVVAITALSEMAQEELRTGHMDKEELCDLLARIEESSGRLKYFVDELLQFAQAESLTPVIQAAEVAEVTRSAMRELEPAANAKGITLTALGKRQEVRTDPDELRQILVNLVQNAVKYMPKDRTDPMITVFWEVNIERLEIVVEDNGAGIPDDVRARLFQPFTHGSQGDNEPDGAGLGLSIVKRLADALDIMIHLETPSGGGSRFRLTFPHDALIREANPTGTDSRAEDTEEREREEAEMTNRTSRPRRTPR